MTLRLSFNGKRRLGRERKEASQKKWRMENGKERKKRKCLWGDVGERGEEYLSSRQRTERRELKQKMVEERERDVGGES